MFDKEVLTQVTAKAQQWLSKGYDAQTQEQVRAMLAADDKTELVESFYKDLEFGTGGLRGIMGAGSNRMNIYTKEQLIGSDHSEEEICQYIGADSLHYLSEQALFKASGRSGLCTACFSGNYPTDLYNGA